MHIFSIIYQAYENNNDRDNISTKKIHPTMNPEKDRKLCHIKVIFYCFKMIATYINPALYCIFFIVYVIIYAI